VAGVENGEKRRFDNLLTGGAKNSSGDDAAVATNPSANSNDSNSQTAQQQIQMLESFALLHKVFSNYQRQRQFTEIRTHRPHQSVWKLGLRGGKRWGIGGRYGRL
jgi:hypothetical protein